MTLADGLELGTRVSAEALGHPDVDEVVDAFRNKREPRFGRREVQQAIFLPQQ